MMFLFLFVAIMAICWPILLAYLHFHLYTPQKRATKGVPTSSYPLISIIVPARNEETNISRCLETIVENNFPRDRFEIIIVNDHSTDATVEKIEEFMRRFPEPELKLIHLDELTGKKNAITTALASARGEIRLFTDADCIAPPNWIREMSAPFLNSETLVAFGIVAVKADKTYLGKWQEFEQANIMAVTQALFAAGVPVMASAANMGFHKNLDKLFVDSVGQKKTASGDDVFFLHSIIKNKTINYAFVTSNEAVVETLPAQSMSVFIRQRIRWSAKAKYYQNFFAKSLGAVIILAQFAYLISLPLAFIEAQFMMPILLFWLLKIGMEFIFHKRFLQEKSISSCRFTFWASLIYPFYSFFAGMGGLLTTRVTWKGRKVYA